MEAVMKSRLRGWPYVDQQMQNQIAAGTVRPSVWSKWLSESGLQESWNAYNAWKEANPGEECPPEIRAIPEPSYKPTLERFSSETKWKEAIAAYPKAEAKEVESAYRQVHKFLLDSGIYRPGELLRAYGLTPSETHELELILLRVNADKIGMQKRIADGDDDLVHGLLRGKSGVA